MLDIIFWITILLVSLAMLIKSSDYFIESAEKIGLYLGVSCFIMGVTVLSVGTSLPELISSIFAVIKNSSEIVVGNVVGSNIANILLIMGISASITRKVEIKNKYIYIDLLILILASIMLIFTSMDSRFSLYESFVFIVAIVGYFIYVIKSGKAAQLEEYVSETMPQKAVMWKSVLILLASCFFIYLGSDWTITSIIKLSEILNIQKELIAISAVAIGTSLPELMVSISAVRKGNSDMMIGNILGSCVFNIFGIMGIAGLFGTLKIPGEMLKLAIPFMLMATVLFFLNGLDRKISRPIGIFYTVLYFAFPKITNSNIK